MYLKAHHDAMFLIEFTTEKLKICFQSFFLFKIAIVSAKKRENLKIDQIYQINFVSYMYNILKQRNYPMLAPSLCISYPSLNCLTRSSNVMLLPFRRVEAIRMKFKYQFVKAWLEVPKYIKYKQSYMQFRNAKSEFYLAQ